MRFRGVGGCSGALGVLGDGYRGVLSGLRVSWEVLEGGLSGLEVFKGALGVLGGFGWFRLHPRHRYPSSQWWSCA